MEQIMNYIRPELLVLIPVLYFIGVAMKQSKRVKDNWIPAILGAVGVLLCILYVLATSTISSYQAALMAVFVALTQGILCAGCSVYVNQVIKQGKEGK